jgi:transposase
VNESTTLRTNVDLDSTYSVTILTNLCPMADHPIITDIREQSNTSMDFLNIVVFWIEQNHLTAGDFLIVDNATVHLSDETHQALFTICNAANVSFKLLPTYSPELNPCELVFSIMKHHLRYWRGTERFWLEIIIAAASLTYEQVFSFYSHCLNK